MYCRRSLEGIPTVFHFSQKGARIRISWNLLGKDPPTLKSECGEPSFLDIVVNNHCARHVYKVLSLEKRQSRDPVGWTPCTVACDPFWGARYPVNGGHKKLAEEGRCRLFSRIFVTHGGSCTRTEGFP